MLRILITAVTTVTLEELRLYRNIFKLEMWANAQRDGHPAAHRWRRLFNAAKFD